MKRLALLACLLAACNSATPVVTTSPIAPTATLRALPTQTATPAFPTALPTDTPLPTPTPLPTATPIVYIIQSGDTLIGIAVKNNVSLEALETVNPGINPGNLQVGQGVFIPPPEEDPLAPNQAVLATPLPITIPSFACSPTPVASLVCLSEFTNTTDQPIINLSVRVTLLNSDNSIGDSTVAFSPLDLIPPGMSVPLGAVFNGGSQRVAITAPITAEVGGSLADLYATLTTMDVTGASDEGGVFTLTGTITNTSPTALNTVVLVGTVYNSAGAVTGYRKEPWPQPLASGEMLSFRLTMPGVTSAARWQVVAQGRTR
jgi:LysM repeat protein